MPEFNRQEHSKKPKREDFKHEIEYDLALVHYWYGNNDKGHRLWKTMEGIEATLRCKLGMYVPEETCS